MELTDDQKNQVSTWVRAGASLSEVQRRLTEEFAISMTYMDVRFLILDLELTLKEKRVAPTPEPEPEAPDVPGEPASGETTPAGGSVSIELDRVMKPGSLVSGTVRFSDGVQASWALDQFGRLALDAGRPGYQPSPDDVQQFQAELRRTLEQRGF
jgi:hypothetical protein